MKWTMTVSLVTIPSLDLQSDSIRELSRCIDYYAIDDKTRDDSMLALVPKDPEIEFNEDVVQFRKSMDVMETYTDRFLPTT
jgi:hypothetical protein